MPYRIRYKNELSHKGIKGMKWGYNDGERNGKRTAETDENDGFEIGKTRKMTVEGGTTFYTPKGSHEVEYQGYYVKSPETNDQWTKVNKQTYSKTKSGRALYYNNKKVTSIVSKAASKTVKSLSSSGKKLVNKGSKFVKNFLKR